MLNPLIILLYNSLPMAPLVAEVRLAKLREEMEEMRQAHQVEMEGEGCVCCVVCVCVCVYVCVREGSGGEGRRVTSDFQS